MKPGDNIESGDIETLAEILEHEKASHVRTRSLCFALFVFSFVVLIVALAVVAVHLGEELFGPHARANLGASLWQLQLLAPLCAIVVSFFTAWWAVQNCINSIERTLFAARAKRHHLFAKFLEQIQCAEKKKRMVWLDVVKSVVVN